MTISYTCKLLAAICLLVLCSSNVAQADGKRELIEQLLDSMRLWDSTAALFENNPGMLMNDIVRRYPRLGREDATIYAEAFKQLYLEDLESSSSVLRQSYIDFYDRNFTLSEISEMNGFFSSDTAQKYLDIQGPLIQEVMVITDAWSNSIGPRLHDRVEKMLENE